MKEFFMCCYRWQNFVRNLSSDMKYGVGTSFAQRRHDTRKLKNNTVILRSCESFMFSLNPFEKHAWIYYLWQHCFESCQRIQKHFVGSFLCFLLQHNLKKMVRSVYADTSVEKYLDNLIERDEFSYGIIIGQVKIK